MATFGMILTTGTPSPIDFSIELILIPATVETIICLDEEKLFFSDLRSVSKSLGPTEKIKTSDFFMANSFSEVT